MHANTGATAPDPEAVGTPQAEETTPAADGMDEAVTVNGEPLVRLPAQGDGGRPPGGDEPGGSGGSGESVEGGQRGGGGRAPGRVTLRSDLRASTWDGLVALVVTVAVFVLIWVRIQSRASSTATVMPMMADDPGGFWMYFASQAFGWSALLWAWITVVLGLLLSGARPSWLPLSGPRLERLHRTTSLNTIALIFAHALFFGAELIRHDTAALTAFVEVFVPGGYDSGTGRIAIPVGQAALYLAIPLGLLFYVRHRIGARTWRIMHRFVIVVYVLSVWHTLLYGTNVWFDGWFRTSLWLLQLPIAALFLLRLLRPARRSQKLGPPAAHPGSKASWSLRLTGRLLAAGLVALLITVVATGRDGGRAEPPADTSSTHDHD